MFYWKLGANLRDRFVCGSDFFCTNLSHSANTHCSIISYYYAIHAEKYFQNLIKSTRNQIVFTIFRLIWNQTDIRLDPNQSENGKYNLISG